MQPHAPSWYAATANKSENRPPLQGDTDVDVCVIGAGMTGCSAALHLAERGYRVAVIEENRVGFGASGRSGGQVIAGYNRDQDHIAGLVGKDDANHLWALAEESLTLTRGLIDRHKIECDYRPGHIHVGEKPRHAREMVEAVEEWTKLGRPGVEFLDTDEVRARVASPVYTSGFYDPHGGHLHPMNYTLGLASAAEAAGAVIYEDTPMTGWASLGHDRAEVTTPHGTIRAKWVVMAGNAYLWRTERRIGRKIMPVGTYIIATEPLGEDRARALIPGDEAVADVNFVLNYFRRSSDHRMLFGGRVSYSRVEPGSVARAMQETMIKTLPQLSDAKVDYAWGGYVAITVNRLPHFGRLADNVLFAQGFSGHGVALTGLAGKLMAEVIAGQAERFDVVTRIPHMGFPGGTLFRTPMLVLAMQWHKLRDML